MGAQIRVSHVIWGYLGGGVDSVLDSYLQADELLPGKVASHVVIVRSPGSTPEKLPKAGSAFDVVPNGISGIWNAARATARLIKNNESDVVFLNGFNATILGFLLRWYLSGGTPIVSTYHGAYFARSRVERLKAEIFNRLERRFFRRHATAVIAVSHHSAALLKAARVPAKKIIVLHNAVALSPSEIAPKVHSATQDEQRPVKIITVSRLVPPKGLDILIRAFQGVARAFPKTELEIVGSGPLEMELKSLVQDLSLCDRVRFLGNRTDIAELLATANVFAMTSRQENHSISILEAMRAGLPLVVTDVGGNSESVRDGCDGFLVPDRDVSAAERAISELVASPEVRARFGRSARARYEAEFESSILVRNLYGILTELVGSEMVERNG